MPGDPRSQSGDLDRAADASGAGQAAHDGSTAGDSKRDRREVLRWRRGRLIGVAALAGAVAVPVALLGGMMLRPHMPQPVALSVFGGPFALTDQNGRVVTDADLRGRWTLLYFGYTHCPDACPTALNAIAEALDRLGSKRAKIAALFVTLDPERDTAAVLKDYTGAFRAGIVGLTGTPAQIAKVAGEYRISYEKHPLPEEDDYSIDHTSVIFLLDPQGRTVSMFSHETAPDRLAQAIQQVMR